MSTTAFDATRRVWWRVLLWAAALLVDAGVWLPRAPEALRQPLQHLPTSAGLCMTLFFAVMLAGELRKRPA